MKISNLHCLCNISPLFACFSGIGAPGDCCIPDIATPPWSFPVCCCWSWLSGPIAVLRWKPATHNDCRICSQNRTEVDHKQCSDKFPPWNNHCTNLCLKCSYSRKQVRWLPPGSLYTARESTFSSTPPENTFPWTDKINIKQWMTYWSFVFV